MRVNVEHKAAVIEETPQNQEKSDLSRRTFLARLTILGVGCAAVMTLGVGEAEATTETEASSKAKDLAKNETAELVDGFDPDDPLESYAQVRRRVARRRVRRVRRRLRRRVIVRRGVARRRVRRVRRRVRRRVIVR